MRGALRSQNELTRLKAAALVLRVSGMQGDMKADKKTEDPEDKKNFLIPILSQAIGEVANEMGLKDPSKY